MPLPIKLTDIDQNMQFWGICCESGKQYAQVAGQRFCITMAVLDPTSSPKSDDKIVSLIAIRGGTEYLLCVLKHGEIHQVNLNLIFDKSESVKVFTRGYGNVCLSGYQLTELDNEVLDDKKGYLCPLVEVTTSESKPEKKGKMLKAIQSSSPQAITLKTKSKSKESIIDTPNKKKKNTKIFKIEDLDSDDESDDEDFIIESDDFDDDSSECGDKEEEDGEEEEDEENDDNEDDDEQEEVEKEDEDDDDDDDEKEDEEEDDDEEDKISFFKGSQKKRKLNIISQPQKRSKMDSFTNSPRAFKRSDSDNGLKDLSDIDILNSSIGHTPMPKKQEKKNSKKKRLSEVSNISEVNGQKSPAVESTPNKSKVNSVQKLEGGVEIQDVIIGKGPEARVGKMVHIFYIGRIQQTQEIFESVIHPKNKPMSFKLGDNNLIKGWDIGIQGMRVGGRRKVKIPPKMGLKTPKKNIPQNSTLNFVIDLVAVN